jgi:predicted tellurium resistance membrane protein TerC
MALLEYDLAKSYPAVKMLFGCILLIIGFMFIVNLNQMLAMPLEIQLTRMWEYLGVIFVAYGLFQLVDGMSEWGPTKVN